MATAVANLVNSALLLFAVLLAPWMILADANMWILGPYI
ncbi:hypothetical protein APED_30435 [Acanthopleuribacter pedis]